MGKRSIILTAALTAALALGTPAGAYADSDARSSPFSDVGSGDWFCSAVLEGKERGIIDGYTDGYFRPQRTVSYGEFIKMAVGGKKAAGPGTHWASGSYNYARQQGYLTARDIPQSVLDDPIPRRYMAMLFANILASGGYAEGDIGDAPFTDVSRDERYEYQIAVCTDAGVLSGYKDGSFRPDEVLSRAEAASALVRFYRLLDGSALGHEAQENAEDYRETAEQPSQALPEAPSDAADSSLKTALDGIMATVSISEESPCGISYSNPQIPEDQHFSLRISCEGNSSFYYQSDAGYMSDPALYDPSAGDHHIEMPGLGGSSCSFLFTLSRADFSASVSYLIVRSSDGSRELYLGYHNGGDSTLLALPVNEELFGR